jgi:heat shock protein HspQ
MTTFAPIPKTIGKICEHAAMESKQVKFKIGQVVRHRLFPFRGVIFDVDPEFANTEEWWLAIPEDMRPQKKQPFYHLLAENAQTHYVAYVSQQNLLGDDSGEPVHHPEVSAYFGQFKGDHYDILPSYTN